MSKAKQLPLFRRYRESGSVLANRSGVEASLKVGGDAASDEAVWNVVAGTLGGLIPITGDYLRDTAGRWWEVVSVEDEADGQFPCACRRWKEGDS